MTDHPVPDAPDEGDLPEVDPTFELASALHDGEAADAERARAGAPDQAALRLVAAVARQVGDVPSPPAALLDAHVAAALAELERASSDRGTGAGAVVTLAERRPWWQRLPIAAVAAAVAVVALAGVIGLAAARDDGRVDDDSATAALEAGVDAAEDEAGDGADDAGPSTFDAESGAAAGGTALTAGERPAYASYDELAAALAEQAVARGSGEPDAAAPTSDATAAPAAPPAEEHQGSAAGCDAVGAVGVDPTGVQQVVPALVADRLVTAVVHGAGGERTLSVVDDETCTVVEQRPL
jgi:negative regulator of sigma E activity